MLTGEDIAQLQIVEGLSGKQSSQVQPNGCDIRLDAVWRLSGGGQLGRLTSDRKLCSSEPMQPDAEGWFRLSSGPYGIRYLDVVALPPDCAGLAFPRSSLLRIGVTLPTAVWDAGYRGRGEGLLVVQNQHGAALQRGAAIAQLIVFRLERAVPSYAGAYQSEGL